MGKFLTSSNRSYPIREGQGLITIKGMLARSAGLYPYKTALQMRRGEEFYKVTYRELKERVDQLSSGLAHRGLGHGDRVAILGENCPEWVESYLAVTGMGAVAVPLDSQLKSQEIRHILTDSEAQALIVSNNYAEVAAEAATGLPLLKHIFSMNDLALRAGRNQDPETSGATGRSGSHHLYLGHHRILQGGDADPQEHHVQCGCRLSDSILRPS